MKNLNQHRLRSALLITTLVVLATALLAVPVSILTAQDNALSLSDFDQSGLDVQVLALFEAGGHETLYSDPDSRWGQSGSLVDGDIALSDDSNINRVMVTQSDGSLFRLNDNGSLVLRDHFAQAGSGHDLTIWIQTSDNTTSFTADDVQSAGSNYVNFNVPPSSRYVLTDFVLHDRFILALTRPDTDPPAPVQKPSAPTGLTGSLQDGDITLSWTAPTGDVTGYRVFRGNTSKKLSTLVSDTASTTTTETDDTVSAGNTYYYAVAAINSAGTGEQTATTSVTIPSAVRQDTPDTPDPPTSTSEPNPGDLPSETATSGVVAPDSAAKGYVKAVTDWFDTDWFKANLTASQEYRIEMLGTPTVTSCNIKAPIIYGIHDSDGNLIANTKWSHDDRDHYDKLNFTPDSTGDYYVALTGDTGGDHGIGTYILALTTAGAGSDARITTIGNAGCFTHTAEPEPAAPTTPNASAPTIKRGQVNAATVTFTFNENLDSSSTPAGSVFTVKVDGSAVTLASTSPVSISDADLTLTLATAVAAAQKVTVSYTAPTSNPLQDGDGNAVAAFVDRKISNITTPRRHLKVTNIQFSDEALYSSGDNLDITVTLNHPATVGANSVIYALGNHEPEGSLYCKDDQGIVSSTAHYHSGTGTANIVFRCVVHDQPTTRVSVRADRVHIVGTSPDYFDRQHPAYQHTTSAHGLTGPTITDITINSTSGSNGTWDPGDTVEISFVFSENVVVGGTPKLRVQPVKSTNFISEETLEYDRVENDDTVIFSGTVTGTSTKSYRLVADAIRLDRGHIAQSVTEAIADLSHRALSGSTALVPPCGSTIPGHVWCARMTVGTQGNELGFKAGSYGSLGQPSTIYGTVDRVLYDQNLDFRLSRNGFATSGGNRPKYLQLTLGDRHYDVSTAVKMGPDGSTQNWDFWRAGGVRWVGDPYNPKFTDGDRVTVRMILVSLVVSVAQESRDITVNEGDAFTFEFGLDNPAVTDLDVKVIVTTRYAYPKPNGFGLHTITIPAGQSRASIPIQTTDDDVLAHDQNVFLNILPTDRYSADGVGKTKILNGSYVPELDTNGLATGNIVFDSDDDSVSVGWENCNSTFELPLNGGIVPAMHITIAEDAGMAEINMVMEQGLVSYNFSLVLINQEGSASRHNDYVDDDVNGPVVMKALQQSAVVSVGIVDNKQLEDTGDFHIWLFGNALTDQIAIGCKYLVVEITDDDTANLLVGEESHTVTEGDTISFDVDVENERGDCIIPFPITVNAEPSTGAALLETADQAPKSVRFPSCDASQTFEFETVVTPGTQADQTVVFEVERASNTDSRITLEGQSSVHQYTVTIQDDGN